MSRYAANDLAFELPDVGFVDRTQHDLDLPLERGHSLALVVSRRPLEAGESLRTAVDAHLAEEAIRRWTYRLRETRDATVDGEPAIETFATWTHSGVELYTREAHVIGPRGLLTFAILAPIDRRDLCDACIEHAVRTFRFQQEGEAHA